MKRSVVVLLVFAVFPASARAEKVPDDFRAAFEAVWKEDKYKGILKGRIKRVSEGTYAVVLDRGVPASSIYGQTRLIEGADYKGERYKHYRYESGAPQNDYRSYPVDVVQGRLLEGKEDKALLRRTLARGEVVRVLEISYKDDRIDFMVEAKTLREVKRGSSSDYEEVSTRYRFAVPGSGKLGAGDVPAVLASIELHLKPFPDEAAALEWSAAERFKPLPASSAWPATLAREKVATTLRGYQASVPERPNALAGQTTFTAFLDKQETLLYLQMALDGCDAGEAKSCEVLSKFVR